MRSAPPCRAFLRMDLREQLVAVLAMRLAIRRRKSPVLAAGSKLVRRRTHASPGRIETAGSPTDPRRSGRSPAPDRDTARSSSRARSRAPAPRPAAGRSAIAGTCKTEHRRDVVRRIPRPPASADRDTPPASPSTARHPDSGGGCARRARRRPRNRAAARLRSATNSSKRAGIGRTA